MTHLTKRAPEADQLHACGGRILASGHAAGDPQRHSYCARCGAFAHGDDPVPSGTDPAVNDQAWNDGEDRSPSA